MKEKSYHERWEAGEVICPECGNTATFVEEGLTNVKQTVEHSVDKKGKPHCKVIDREVKPLKPSKTTCTECGMEI